MSLEQPLYMKPVEGRMTVSCSRAGLCRFPEHEDLAGSLLTLDSSFLFVHWGCCNEILETWWLFSLYILVFVPFYLGCETLV